MSSIKKFILEQVGKRALSQEEAKRLLTELGALDAAAASTAASAPGGGDEPLAIVGMAGRFPRAGDAQAFWELLRNGLDCIGDFPEPRRRDFEHILANPSYTEFLIGTTIAPEARERAHARAGYLDEIDKFDAAFFGIPPAEATFMDPHQRLALEVAWEAMEDAGYGGGALHGSDTGIYIGKEGTNYSLYRYTTVSHPMQLTGSWESIMASRIAYLFNLRGPCMLVDTACSAGLVSVHMAARAILSGECEQALAGGINLSITGEFGRGYQGSMAMEAVESSDGAVRTFDARANGTVWGEGVAMVLIKRLSRALADGDPIHAVILGSAINNDGAASGLTAPDAAAQEAVITRAWTQAGIDPATLDYVEAHGTGTVLGDPIEFKALSAAFRRHTAQRQFCAIGSLKTNMGHLVAASGVASLFKVVKSLQARELAPTINFGEPNPYINFLASPLYVNDTLRPWPAPAAGHPRRAALSSFGFSHTNCHMVVQEAPERGSPPPARAAYCLTLSAPARESLREYALRLSRHLARRPAALADLCFTCATGRGHHAHRLAIVARTAEEAQRLLALAPDVIEGRTPSAQVLVGHHAVVSDRQRTLAEGEITEKTRKALGEQAQAALAQWLGGDGSDTAALQALARLYVAGAPVEWAPLYAGEARLRLSLPTFPLQRVRVWAAPKISKVEAVAESRLHPLVHRVAARAPGELVLESVFRIGEQWVLSDHRIQGSCVVPGTTYLEMARVAALQARGWERIELRDVFFLVPMVVAEGQARRVRLSAVDDAAGLRWAVESRAEGEGSDDGDGWLRHAEGLARECEPAPQGDTVALEALRHAATETIEHFVAETDTGVFQFGPHWDAIRSAWRLGEDALARLALPPALAGEMAVFRLHPSVMDNAVNLVSQGSGTYLPFSYKSLRMHAPLAGEVYSHVVAQPRAGSSGQTLRYDVTLTDASGRVLVRITDYVVKKVTDLERLGGAAPDQGADGEVLLPRWVAQPQPLAEAGAAPAPRRLLLLAAEATARVTALAGALQAAGVAAQVHALGAAPAQALRALAEGGELAGAQGIVFAADGGPLPAQALADAGAFAQRRGGSVEALFHLARALQQAKAALPWGLAVLGFEAHAVDGSEGELDPLAAATLALGSVIGMEHAQWPCRLVDAAAGAEAGALARALLQAPPGRLLALRAQAAGLQALVRELHPARLPEAAAPPLRDDGFYLVTGGAGGLGLALARDLARRGRVRVLLTGRTPLAPPAQWPALARGEGAEAARYAALAALSEELAALDYQACDVGDAAAVQALLAHGRAAHGPLRGVFHLAGVAGDGFLWRKDPARFDAVLRPKLDGARHLLAATAGDAPDVFALFSSIVALTGGEGQGDYAAANAFLDALAARAQASGRRVQSLNWPSWREVGMAAAFQVGEDAAPFLALSPQDALARLQRVLAHPALAQVLPSTIQPAALAAVREQLPFVLAPELLRRLPRGAGAPAGAGAAGADAAGAEVAIRGKNAEDLGATEAALARIYAAVLGLSEIDVFASFHDMGGNSLIATHLLKLIEAHFPGLVDISDVFSYASVDEMAAYVEDKLARRRAAEAPAAAAAAPGTQAGAAPAAPWDAVLERVADGDDAALDALLDQIR